MTNLTARRKIFGTCASNFFRAFSKEEIRAHPQGRDIKAYPSQEKSDPNLHVALPETPTPDFAVAAYRARSRTSCSRIYSHRFTASPALIQRNPPPRTSFLAAWRRASITRSI
eukprot:2183349-Pleurochrysis_carterae.AAC.2